MMMMMIHHYLGWGWRYFDLNSKQCHLSIERDGDEDSDDNDDDDDDDDDDVEVGRVFYGASYWFCYLQRCCRPPRKGKVNDSTIMRGRARIGTPSTRSLLLLNDDNILCGVRPSCNFQENNSCCPSFLLLFSRSYSSFVSVSLDSL